ncbi:MAG: PDZ domain-containing protein [Planctomycetota bacterium]
MRLIYSVVIVLAIFFGWSCTTAKPPEQKPDTKKILDSLQDEINKAVKIIQPSLVYAELGGGRSVSNMTGLVISPDGQIFLPTYLKRDSSDRLQIWMNEKEYEASLVQSDDRLKMSIVKIQTDIPLTPVNFGNAYVTQPGQFVIGVVNGGKPNDFRLFVDVGFIRGRSDEGEFDQIQSIGLTSNQGAVMMTLDGMIIAVQLKSSGASDYGRTSPQGWIVSNEITKGISKLITKLSVEKSNVSSEEEKEKMTPWLGFGWAPINEDYAEVMKLPKKSIIVRYVMKNSPIERAGLKEEDLIVEIDNKPLTKIGSKALESQFIKYIDPEIDREITFKVLRGTDYLVLKTKFVKKPEPKEFRAEDIGIAVQEITDADYYQMGLLTRKGVLVNNVLPGSPAAATVSGYMSLIRRDDVIIELNRTPVLSIEDFINVVETIRREKLSVVLVKIANGPQTSFVALNLKAGKK